MTVAGFTLVELLIVIAIIGILVAILLPAIQATREAARRSQCANYLKQIAMAFHMHHDAHGSFSSGGWGYRWAGDPDGGFGKSQPGSWAYSCLPYLEEKNLHQLGARITNASEKKVALTQILESASNAFYCPSRRRALATPNTIALAYAPVNANQPKVCARSDYAANVGPRSNAFSTLWFDGPKSMADAGNGVGFRDNLFKKISGVVFQRSEIHFSHISDGISSTYMVGEKWLMPEHYESGRLTSDDQSAWVGDDLDLHRVTSVPPAQDRDGEDLSAMQPFGSAHPEIFQMVMCDTSIQAIRLDIEESIHRRLGGMATNLFPCQQVFKHGWLFTDSMKALDPRRTQDSSMRNWLFVIPVLLTALATRDGLAVSIPILDPGFDIYTSNTLNLVPGNVLPNLGSPGAGSGPLQNFLLLDFNTFAILGNGDIPAGWTATGQKPNSSANTGRVRCDACFLDPSGSLASINSFHDENDPSTQGRFFQTLVGVGVQPNTRYTATVEVSDVDIMGHGPFAPQEDNIVLGDPARIMLSLSAVSSAGNVELEGQLQFADITPGGWGQAEARISGGKSRLTLTVDTGSSVPGGDLQIAFTAGGVFGELPGSFASSAQTFFDNVTIDASPLPTELDGDFNQDRSVDAADYVAWRHDLTAALDYDVWRANFGNVNSLNAAATSGPSSVPEADGVTTILLAMGFILIAYRQLELPLGSMFR